MKYPLYDKVENLLLFFFCIWRRFWWIYIYFSRRHPRLIQITRRQYVCWAWKTRWSGFASKSRSGKMIKRSFKRWKGGSRAYQRGSSLLDVTAGCWRRDGWSGCSCRRRKGGHPLSCNLYPRQSTYHMVLAWFKSLQKSIFPSPFITRWFSYSSQASPECFSPLEQCPPMEVVDERPVTKTGGLVSCCSETLLFLDPRPGILCQISQNHWISYHLSTFEGGVGGWCWSTCTDCKMDGHWLYILLFQNFVFHWMMMTFSLSDKELHHSTLPIPSSPVLLSYRSPHPKII